MRFIFTYIFLLSGVHNLQAQVELDIDKLACKRLALQQQYVEVNAPDYYGDKLPVCSEAIYSPLIKCKINSNPLMYHYAYYSLPVWGGVNKEYFTYYDTRVSMDSLLKNNVGGVAPFTVMQHYFLFTGSYYHFTFNDEKFILINACDRNYSRNSDLHVWFLLKVDGRKLLNCYAFWDGPEVNPNFLDDFNGDGHLDYLDWQTLTSRVSIYSLVGNRFVKDKEHYIITYPSKSQTEYWKNYGQTFERYKCVDEKTSHWFFPI